MECGKSGAMGKMYSYKHIKKQKGRKEEDKNRIKKQVQ